MEVGDKVICKKVCQMEKIDYSDGEVTTTVNKSYEILEVLLKSDRYEFNTFRIIDDCGDGHLFTMSDGYFYNDVELRRMKLETINKVSYV